MVSREARLHLCVGVGHQLWLPLMTLGSGAPLSLVSLCRWIPGPGRGCLRTSRTQGLMLGASFLPRGHDDLQNALA